jgi:uncharacterized protein (DUF1697 family)
MRYVAFLRAINVGGRVVKMAALKKAFEPLPVKNVETFIASGNVIFDTGERDMALLERQTEARLRQVFRYEVDTFIRSIDELQRIAVCAPFQEVAAAGEGGTVYVGFLRESPGPEAGRKLAAISTEMHQLVLSGREVFWLRRDAPQDAGAPPAIEKVLGRVSTTFRNARTVKRIAAKYRI